MKRSFRGVHRPLLPFMLTQNAETEAQPSAAIQSPIPPPQPSQPVQSTTLTQPITSPQPSNVQIPTSPPQPTPIPTQPITSSSPPITTIPETQPTHPPSLHIPSSSHFSPHYETEGPPFEPPYHMSPPSSIQPEVPSSRTSEESEQLRNLLDLVPRLESRVESLEKELSETKQTLGTAVLKLIKKVKKLEDRLKKKRQREETEDEEDAEDQDQDGPSIKGSQAPPGSKIYRRKPKSTATSTKVLDFEEPHESPVNTASIPVNTGSTPLTDINIGEAEHVQRREGKAPMTEEDLQAEVQASKRSKELQELADLEEAKRLQAQLDAEAEKQIHFDELLARRLVEQEEEAAKEALTDEYDYIQARINADQILAEKLQQEEREQYSLR
ncbi:hypothetical protein Tco_1026183 [Tanacetum coccineum]